jgi:GAF domain-containing protein
MHADMADEQPFTEPAEAPARDSASRRPDRNAERRALARVLQAIAMRQRATDAYRIVAAELRALLGASTVALGLTAEPGGPMDFVAVDGRDPREIVGLRVAADDTLSFTALRLGRPSVLHPDSQSAIRSGAVAPIVSVSGVRGAIYAVDKEDGSPFDEDDLSLMASFAHAAALIVECDQLSRDLTEKARELAVLYESARTVTSSLNIQAVLNSVLDAICHHIPVQAAALYLLNDERTHLFIAADRGLNDDEREVQLAADSGVAAKVLAEGQPLLLPDALEPLDADLPYDGLRQRSAMVAPIRSAAETLGMLLVTSAEPAAYGSDELRLLSTVAAQAGIAMDNASLFEDATRRAEAATALYNISQRIGSTLDIREALDFVADNAIALLQVDKFAAMLMDHRDGRLHPQAMRGLDDLSFSRITPRSGEGIPGWVFEWTAPTAVADVAADARDKLCPIHQEGVASCICVPMASGDTALGVLLAMSSRRRLFTVAELELLYTIANQTAAAAMNATSYARAQARAQAMRRYFRRLAAALGATVDRSHILQLVTDVGLDVMEADRCNIYAIRGDSLHLEAQSRLTGSSPSDPEMAIGEGLTGWVAARGRSLAVPVLADDPRTRSHSWGGRESLASYLGLPLKAGRRTTGVLELMTRDPRSFASEEIRLLSQFISRARIGERLQEDTDS